ncbi:MAG: ubiquinol oxidase subunit II [Gammaproteobacteria bacterium]|nr:MAG: ubiquinol oxidase subunit II [Gammaproteobacteria bacterium]
MSPFFFFNMRRLLLAACYAGLAILLSGCKAAVLDPKGMIAADEKHILILSALLMLIVVIPVIVLTFVFAWRYRASNTKATYAPEWAHSNLLEVICWSVPCVIIVILSVITWTSSHRLDPYKPLDIKNGKPIIIEAISLEWKWLFIYPEQNIATVNFVQFPVNTPVRFLISAEGPMNSFQIPQLGGQIYAMAGMQTKLNLIANTIGDYQGVSANFSGEGFTDMKFIARVSSQDQFEQWVKTVKRSPTALTMTAYDQLIQPSENNPVAYYSSATKDLFNTVIMKSMMPMAM